MENDEIKKEIEHYYRLSNKPSGAFDLGNEKIKKAYINEVFKNSTGAEIYKIIEKYRLNPQELKLLDAGCGLGGIIVACENHNIKAIGIDIDKDAIAIARQRVKNPENILIADGENLPFKNNSFDIVTSIVTIEHVQNPRKYLSEAFRVLKNNGVFIIYAPNYLFPWEGHYKTIWFPYLLPYTKFILRLYLILKNKNTEFLNAINFKITPGYLKKLLKVTGFKNIQDISTERFLEKLKNPAKIANPGLENIVIKFKKNKILTLFLRIFVSSLRITKLYHPIIFTAEVKKHD